MVMDAAGETSLSKARRRILGDNAENDQHPSKPRRMNRSEVQPFFYRVDA
jgi:hypothetical protein